MRIEYKTLISDMGVPYNHFTIGDEQTYRTYFGRHTWLPDDSGFVCGKKDGSFYFYDVAAQELNYLDSTPKLDERQTFVATYINPSNGLVYYPKRTEKNEKQLWCINPKTHEKKLLFSTDNPRMAIGLEVTNDGRYTYYFVDQIVWASPDEPIEFGRIDLENGVIDRTQHYAFKVTNCINHFILNPEDPELLLFHHEVVNGYKPPDRLNVMNLSTGEVITYAQPGDQAAHAMWSYDGQHITFTDYFDGTRFAITDKDFSNHRSYLIEYKYGGGNHCMMDASGKYVLADDYMGVGFMKLETQEAYAVMRRIPHLGEKHCYDPHSEMSISGKIASWGVVNENDILGVAWLDTSYFTDK